MLHRTKIVKVRSSSCFRQLTFGHAYWDIYAAFMKFPIIVAALSALTLGSCALIYSHSGTPFGPDDYAVGLAQPYPSEARLAQMRLHNFLSRANARNRQV